jgi:hypothetical protein
MSPQAIDFSEISAPWNLKVRSKEGQTLKMILEIKHRVAHRSGTPNRSASHSLGGKVVIRNGDRYSVGMHYLRSPPSALGIG